MNYVAGFMFSHDRSRVALIRKSKPAWQAGKLNGIGGKIEIGEDGFLAMQREFQEETGYLTTIKQWEHFCMMSGRNNSNEGDFRVDFFVTVGDLSMLRCVTDEEIVWAFTEEMNPARKDVIENIPWLIGLALDYLEDGRPSFVTVKY